MGQYLTIGVTYEIHVNKANSVKRIEDLESLKNELNQEYNPNLWFSDKHEPMLSSFFSFGEHGEYYYQDDYYHDYIYHFENGYRWEIPTTLYSVNLSVDGKAFMEYFGYGVIDFFERLIKEKLQPFRLRDAFNIHFTL